MSKQCHRHSSTDWHSAAQCSDDDRTVCQCHRHSSTDWHSAAQCSDDDDV